MQTFFKNGLASLALCAFGASLGLAAAAKGHARERVLPLPPAAPGTQREVLRMSTGTVSANRTRVRVLPPSPASAVARRDVRNPDGQVTATLTDLTRTTATFRGQSGETHTYRISDADYERLSSEIGQEITYGLDSGDRIVLSAVP